MSFITIAGENQIAAKFISGDLDISHFVLANITGLGQEPADRIEAMPNPADIVDTQPVGKEGYVNNNLVVYSVTLDSTIGDYSFNWVGLKDSEEVLIAAAYLPALVPKTKTANGTDGNNLVRNFLLEFIGAQALTAINTPAETWQLDLTTRLVGMDDRERLSNVDVYGPGAFFEDGFLVTPGVSGFVDIAPGVGYVGGLRCHSDSVVSIDVSAALGGLWVDAYLLGDANGKAVAFDFVTGSSGLGNYTDSNYVEHFLIRIANVLTITSITDSRFIYDSVSDHEAKDDPHSQYLTSSEGGSLYDVLGSTESHEAEADPHPQYVTDDTYISHLFADDPHSQYLTDDTYFSHLSASDPHSQYLKESDLKSANESTSGVAEVATQGETDAGTDDARMVTPKKLFGGLYKSIANPGYFRFPSWMGGLVLQWGTVFVNENNWLNIYYPIKFPNEYLSVSVNSFFTKETNQVLVLTGLEDAKEYFSFYDEAYFGQFVSFIAIGR